ncbi:uncharacterized protein LOC143038589 [Oratosquilla oratoria]|uniref:uncharacterized protein LOC143038589 n=1 Tax=Oratosquilla oratoria TaxID=337810 RepID=UPI003F763845
MASPFNTNTSSSHGTTTSAAGFGSTSPSSPFSMTSGSSLPFGATKTSATPFGGGEAPSSAAFGSSAAIASPFGSASANPFGSKSSSAEAPAGIQASSPFGTIPQSPSKVSAPAFDKKLTQSPFGSKLLGFSPNTGLGMYRTSAASAMFGAAVSTTPFGGPSTPTFGAISTPSFGSISSPSFGIMSPSFGSMSSYGSISSQTLSTTSTLSYSTMPGTSIGLTSTPRMSTAEAPSFGSPTATSAPTFGSPPPPPSSVFGTASTAGFGATTAPAFGATTALAFGATSAPVFGTTTAPAFGTTTAPAFGTTTAPAFGTTTAPAFGTTTAPAFGTTTAPAFGTTTSPAFGTTTAPAFGTTTAPAFGTTTAPAFGTTTAPAFGTTTAPAFGTTTAPAFGTTTAPAFGTTTAPAFGTTTAPAFGTTTAPAFGTTTAPAFGTTTAPAFGTSSTVFGSSTTPTFGTTAAPVFGTTTSSPMFGVTTTSHVFGATPAPAFGTTTSNPLFGTTTTTAAATTSPFGATTAPSFGNTLSTSTGISAKSGSLGFGGAPTQAAHAVSSASTIGNTSQGSVSTSAVSQSPFGNTPSQSPFGSATTHSPFGASASQETPSTSASQGPFGSPTSQGMFGATTSPSTFGMPMSQGPFGSSTSQGSFGTVTSQRTFGTVTSQATFGTVTSQGLFGTATTHPASSAAQPTDAAGEAKVSVSASKQVPLFSAAKSSTSSSSLRKEATGLLASKSKASESRTSPIPRVFGGTAFQASSSSVSRDSKAESDSTRVKKRISGPRSSPLPLTEDEGAKKKDTLFGKEIPPAQSQSDPLEIVDEVLQQSKKDPKSLESSPEGSEKKEVNKIIAVQIPESCLDKEVLRRHFMKFGKVTRVSVNHKNNKATIQFESSKGAAKAKELGKKLHPKLPEIKIFFGTVFRRKSQEGVKNTFASKKKEGAVKKLRETSHSSEDLEPYRPLARPGTHDDLPYQPLVRPQVAAPSQLPPSPRSAFVEVGSVQSRIGRRPPSSQSPHPPPPVCVEEVQTTRAVKSIVSKTTLSTLQAKPSSSKAARASPMRETKGHSEMKVTLQTKAVTSSEKYFVLDYRDKLLRQQQNKGKAKGLSASCPDMCPEKERYMRDFKNDLSTFEIIKGEGVDHNLAVKKYSRSSADQEEPLPHELRPGKVLGMTMDYLVCNFMDRMEEESIDNEVWYNFIWDRTRAIRKDLTQQQLIDQTAVNLVEKCARFHIHCAARLCEEPPDVFDPKMNTENLTKCLQTLKHLYDDLQVKGQFCENEAKFRSYYMLLNLNEGDIMFEYQQYRTEVRMSTEVQFAVRVLRALCSNNYISFFRLLDEASYLQACILQRYFRQVRTKALEVICKSYSLTSKLQVLPTEKILSALGFENIDDATTYLEFHGIPVTDQGVTFDRSKIILFPEECPPVVRGKSRIESKRTCLVGEVVQGGPMPENPLNIHIPHDSFNDQGFLKHDSVASTKPGTSTPSEAHTQDIPPKAPESARESTKADVADQEARQAYNKELVAVLYETQTSVLNEVVQELANSIAVEVVLIAHRKEAVLQIIHDLIEETIIEELTDYCSKAIKDLEEEEEEKRKKEELEEMLRKKEEEKAKNLAAFVLTCEYEQEVVEDMVNQLCLEIIKEEEEEIKQKVILEIENDLLEGTLEETQFEELSSLVNEVLQQMEGERTQQLQEAKAKAESYVIETFVLRWRDQMLKLKRRQVAMETFPACGSRLSVVEQDEAFSWGYARSKEQNLTAQQLEHLEAQSQRNLHMASLSCRLEEEIAWAPLPLNSLFQKALQASLPSDNMLDRCFKLLLVMPEVKSNLAALWLRSKLGGDTAEAIDCHLFISQSVQGATHHILIQEVAEVTPEKMFGAAGVLYIPTAKELDNDVLKCCQDIEKIASVVVITYAQDRDLPDQRVWPVCDGDLLLPQTSSQLESLVLELWHQRSFGVQVKSGYLTDIFWKMMGRHVVERVLLVEEERISEGVLPPDPSAYVELYNYALEHLINATHDQKLRDLQWPPEEVEGMDGIPTKSWNCTDADLVEEVLSSARLPTLSIPEVATLPQIEKLIQSQIARVVGKEDGTTLLAHVRHIMDRAANDFWYHRLHQEEEFNEGMDVQAHVVVPWWNIVRAFIEYRASLLPDCVMYYRPHMLNSFSTPDTWKRAIGIRKPLNEIVVGEGASKRKAAQASPRLKKRAYVDPEVLELTKKTSDLRVLMAKEKEKLLELEKKIAEG